MGFVVLPLSQAWNQKASENAYDLSLPNISYIIYITPI